MTKRTEKPVAAMQELTLEEVARVQGGASLEAQGLDVVVAATTTDVARPGKELAIMLRTN